MKSNIKFFSSTAKWIECILNAAFEFVFGKVTWLKLQASNSFTPISLWQVKMLFTVFAYVTASVRIN